MGTPPPTPSYCTRCCGCSRTEWATTARNSWTASRATWGCAEARRLVELAALACGAVDAGAQERDAERAQAVEQLEFDAPAAVGVEVENVEAAGEEHRHQHVGHHQERADARVDAEQD